MASKPRSAQPNGQGNAQSPDSSPQESTDSQSQRLPFEPKGQKKPAQRSKFAPSPIPLPSPPQKPTQSKAAAIPEVVSNRMVKRMVTFSGLPTVLGLSTFPLCYWVISQGWYEVPNVAVVLVSMGCLGLGVLGLSYGVLSASWDPDLIGTKIGWSEFKLNFGRLTASWRGKGQNSPSK
jgi:Photosynthesis affected mutant 68